jgi:hypothetical protein
MINGSCDVNAGVNVVIGTPIHRAGAFALDKFLANGKEIQGRYPLSELVFATAESDFTKELGNSLCSWDIRGKVLLYEVDKPAGARHRVWNITCGREAIRQYMLSQTKADYILFLDADMTCDPDIVTILEKEIQGYDIVYAGSHLRGTGIALAGAGCCLIKRDTLKEIRFRCIEFRNGHVVAEDQLLEFDLINLGKKIKKGFFLTIHHYVNEQQAKSIDPQPVGLYRSVTHSKLVRYSLAKLSMRFHYDIGWWLLTRKWRLEQRLRGFLRLGKH